MNMKVSARVLEKLASKVPPVVLEEIEQCFANRTAPYLRDNREQHFTDPPTLWFISETDYGRKLKVAFINKQGSLEIKSAYDPNPEEIRIYSKYAKK
jgi:hypothetical protein